MQKQIVIIADDLTGANDTGAQFAKQSLSTLVVLDPDQLETVKNHEVVVLDTDSRALAPESAYGKVAKAANAVKKRGYGVLYKKVDSTMRGNVGTEIDAIMDVCGCNVAIVAPAYPQNGRTTIGGVHLLKGVPLEATEISRDPKCPVGESNLITLLSAQTTKKIGHIGVKTMLQGEAAITEAIIRLKNEGVRVVVCDIWQEDQFSVLTAAAAKADDHILWVGSAGLAEALPELLDLYPIPITQSRPVLIVAGSVSGVTRRQVERLCCEPGTAIVRTETERFLTDTTRSAHILDCSAQVLAALANGQDTVLVSGYDDTVVAKTKQQGENLGLNPARTSDIVAEGLGKVTAAVMEASPQVSGVVLTGGDTAINICRSLNAYGLQVLSEVAVGIPLGLLEGGPCHGMPVVTKAGAFGEEDALGKAIAAIKLHR